MSKDLSTTRGELANFFRSSEEEISSFFKIHFTKANLESELLDQNLLNHLWDVALLVVKECVVKYNNIEKAQNLLNIFSEYQHTFSAQIEKGFVIVKTCLEKYAAQEEYQQIEALGETSASSTSELLE